MRALLLLWLLFFPLAANATTTQLNFDAYYGDSKLGTHRITITDKGNEQQVDIAIDFKVQLAFITLFEYRHRNREIWRDGKLVSLDATTNDDGERFFVRATAWHDGSLRIRSSSGDYNVPLGTYSTSYWRPSTTKQQQLIDTQSGKLAKVNFTPLGTSDGIDRFAMQGDLTGEVGYKNNRWHDLRFAARGSEVRYFPAGTGPSSTAPN